MSVTENQRHQIFRYFIEVMGEERAAIMMDLLPPVGWGDIVTRADLHGELALLRGEMAELRAGVSGEMTELRAGLSGEMAELRAGVSGEMAELRAGVSGEMAELRAGVSGEMTELRAGLSGEMAELRAGVSGEIGELRAGVSGEMAEVRGEQGSLRGEMLLGFAELKASQAQGLRTLFFANLASMATIAGLVLAAV